MEPRNLDSATEFVFHGGPKLSGSYRRAAPDRSTGYAGRASIRKLYCARPGSEEMVVKSIWNAKAVYRKNGLPALQLALMNRAWFSRSWSTIPQK